MRARWGSFAVGMGLMLAPLVLGYASAGAILQDVAMGLLVCVATIAALEWPRARFVMAAPALALLASGRTAQDARSAVAELASGGLLLALALVPSARRVRRPLPPLPPLARPRGRAGAEA